LFWVIENMRCGSKVTVTGSVVEIYNNHLIDLLKISRNAQGSCHACVSSKLNVRRDSGGSVKVPGLSEIVVKDGGQLTSLFQRGVAHRVVATNAYNVESSRSHVIFTIGVSILNPKTKETRTGKLLLCDLGGSERLHRHRSEVTDKTKTEAIEINKSLTALGTVIEAVAHKQKHIPYRDHKLTQLLQDSVGGTAKAIMFVNCSPAKTCVDETLVSLNYASGLRRVTNTHGRRETVKEAGANLRKQIDDQIHREPEFRS